MSIYISAYAIPGLRYRDPLPSRQNRQELQDKIIDGVLSFYCLSKEKVFRRTRKREVVLARQMMRYLIRQNTNLSLREIGEIIPDNKPVDHTTVIHSCQTIKDLLDTDSVTREQMRQIQLIIY